MEKIFPLREKNKTKTDQKVRPTADSSSSAHGIQDRTGLSLQSYGIRNLQSSHQNTFPETFYMSI